MTKSNSKVVSRLQMAINDSRTCREVKSGTTGMTPRQEYEAFEELARLKEQAKAKEKEKEKALLI